MVAFLYILLCLLWGSTWVAIKIGLTSAPPLYTAAIRFVVAILVLWLIIRIRGDRYPKGWRRWLSLGYPGLYMYCLNYAMVYFAERHISSALAAVLFAAFPFFVAVLSQYRHRLEVLSPAAWFGLAVGFGGVVLISYDQLNASGDLLVGTLLAVGAAFVAAWGMMIHKARFASENIFIAVHVQMIFGGIVLLSSALILEDYRDFVLTAESVGSALYLAVFGTVVTFLSYYWLLARIRAVIASSIAFLTPLVAIAIGVGFFGEEFTLFKIIGTAAILGGVVLVIRRGKTLEGEVELDHG